MSILICIQGEKVLKKNTFFIKPLKTYRAYQKRVLSEFSSLEQHLAWHQEAEQPPMKRRLYVVPDDFCDFAQAQA